MKNLSDYLIPILIGILIGMPFGIYAGSTISTNHAERYRTESVNNAVAVALESTQSPLNCKTAQIIEAIKGMAINGYPVTGYDFFLRSEDNVISDTPTP